MFLLDLDAASCAALYACDTLAAAANDEVYYSVGNANLFFHLSFTRGGSVVMI